MLKLIKKDEKIILEYENENVIITTKRVSKIKTALLHNQEIKLPKGYGRPIHVNGVEFFNNIKELSDITNPLKIRSAHKYSFSVSSEIALK